MEYWRPLVYLLSLHRDEVLLLIRQRVEHLQASSLPTRLLPRRVPVLADTPLTTALLGSPPVRSRRRITVLPVLLITPLLAALLT